MNTQTMVKQYIKPQIKWTQDKIDLLIKVYPLGDKKMLAEKLGIKYKTLKSAAERFGVKSLQDKNFYKLDFLTQDTPIAYYWLGFIFADGYINPYNGELKITLSLKDKPHLEKLANILNINVKIRNSKIKHNNNAICAIHCADKYNSSIIYNKLGLDINLTKTYHPPKTLTINNNNLFISFLLGLIDGDGTFSKRKNKIDFIRIELHRNYYDYLLQIKNKLNNLGFEGISVNYTKKGYVYIRICRQHNFQLLKTFAIKNNLPILERKWNLIDENSPLNHSNHKFSKIKNVENL